MARDRVWKIGVIATCLGAAAVITIASWLSGAGPSDPGDSLTYWTCANCGHEFQMTVEEVRAARASGATSRAAARGTRLTKATDMVRCPACGRVSAVASSKCPVHGIIYPTRTPNGARGRCPRCSGDP